LNDFDVEEVKRLMKEDEENGNQAIKELEKQAREQGKALNKQIKKSEITSSENTATKINNIKSFDDLSNMFEFEKP
jgi:DNA-binding transcriptional MerR regulator